MLIARVSNMLLAGSGLVHFGASTSKTFTQPSTTPPM